MFFLQQYIEHQILLFLQKILATTWHSYKVLQCGKNLRAQCRQANVLVRVLWRKSYGQSLKQCQLLDFVIMPLQFKGLLGRDFLTCWMRSHAMMKIQYQMVWDDIHLFISENSSMLICNWWCLLVFVRKFLGSVFLVFTT